MRLQRIAFMTVLGWHAFAFHAEALAQPIPLYVPSMPGLSESVRLGNVQVVPIDDMEVMEDVKRSIIERRGQQVSQGWVDVDSQQASHIETYLESSSSERLRTDLDEVEHTLHFDPADLRGTFLDAAHFKGALPIGGFLDGKWTGLLRVFEASVLGNVILEEYDYVRAGSYILVPQEVVDSYLDGFPVLYTVLKAPDGTVHTDIIWFTDVKNFRLRIGSEVTRGDGSLDLVEIMFHSLR